jgi:heme A synthase
MNSGAALWQSSGRPLPHLPQPYHQRQSLFSQPTTTTTRPITTPSTSFSTHNNQPFTPKRKFTTTATPQPTAIPTNPESIASMAKKTVKPHDGTKLYPREVWEGLVTESTVRLNKYLEIISANDRRASGLDNNRQMWASQRISPAILHDRFRFVSSLPTMARSQALLSLWLSAANFKSKLPPQSLAVNAWLSTLILLVMGMVSAGGITRLTRSGLSMTTWKFTGEKRPTNESEWEEEFDLYKQSPEYRLHNSDMEIKDFKFIYHMEYGHRTLGRVIGVAFTVPLLLFIANKSISMRTGFGKALVGVLSLGGVQGLIGWWMVKSGLDEKTNVEKAKVSPYRLATHLSIAFTLLVGLTVLKLRARHGIVDVYLADKLVPKSLPNLFGFKAPKRLAHATSMIAFFTAMTGAFVAGNDAGLGVCWGC